jgi:tRNA pseudouridine55 synthase
MEYTSPEKYLDGAVLYIDKPLTWTSFDVVNKIRKSLRHYLGIQKIKVGHAGTLDPLASGLVIICTGKATKQIMQFQDLDKAYTAQVRLGATTPSFDL